MSKAERFHQQLTNELADRLEGWNYEFIEKNENYSVRRHHRIYTGEFDVLTYRNGWWHYYEVKGHNTPGARVRAAKQFARCTRAYPLRNWVFVYYTNEEVLRFRRPAQKQGV